MPRPDPLTILLELTRKLAEERTLEKALQGVTEAALALLPGDHASIRLVDTSEQLLSGARSGTGADSDALVFQPGEGVSGWVVRHNRTARIDDVEHDHRFLALRGQGFAIRSLLVVPLWLGGRVIGVLSVSAPERGAFLQQHEDLARLLANTCIPPIEHARLERLAISDGLTETYNRSYLAPRLRQEMERARAYESPLSLLLLDLDHFKQVNDSFGHAVGDGVLRAFADRTRHQVRRRDVLIRRGGEEFVLLMPATGSGDALAVAERIRRALEGNPVRVGPHLVRQTVSIGVATWDGHESADALEQRADQAMYRAKRAGRNQVAFAAEPVSGGAT